MIGADFGKGKDAAYLVIGGKSFPLVSYEVKYDPHDVVRIAAEAMEVEGWKPSRQTEIEMNMTVAEDAADAVAKMCEELDIGTHRKQAIEELKERDMCGCESAVDKACADPYEKGYKLVRKLRELDLDPQDQLLVKYGLINDDGSLTANGKNFVVQVLFEQYKDDIVSRLEAVDEEEDE